MTAVGMVYNPVPEDRVQWARPQGRAPQFQARYVAGLGARRRWASRCAARRRRWAWIKRQVNADASLGRRRP